MPYETAQDIGGFGRLAEAQRWVAGEKRKDRQEQMQNEQWDMQKQAHQMQMQQTALNLQELQKKKEFGSSYMQALNASPEDPYNAGVQFLGDWAKTNPNYGHFAQEALSELDKHQSDVIDAIKKTAGPKAANDMANKTILKRYGITSEYIGDKDGLKDLHTVYGADGNLIGTFGTDANNQMQEYKPGGQHVSLNKPEKPEKDTWRTLPAVMEKGKPVIYETNQKGEKRLVGEPAPPKNTGNLGIYGNLSQEDQTALENAIAEGRLDPYKVNSRTAPIYAGWERNRPGTNWNQIGANTAQERNPQLNRQAINLEAVVAPIEELKTMAKKLGGSQYPALNKLSVMVKKGMGNTDVVAFEATRNNVMQELANAMRGQGISEGSIGLEMSNWNTAYTPEQLGAAADQTLKVIEAKKQAIRKKPFPQGENKSAPSGPIKVGKFTVEAE